MKKNWHCSQISPVGWYIASFIERTDRVAEFETKVCTHKPWGIWENRILVKASTPDEALTKTKEHLEFYGHDFTNTDGVELRASVVGLTSLIAIHAELEDGAEIEYYDHTGETMTEMMMRLTDEESLEAFTSPEESNNKKAEQDAADDAGSTSVHEFGA
jgi:hypothetical protein